MCFYVKTTDTSGESLIMSTFESFFCQTRKACFKAGLHHFRSQNEYKKWRTHGWVPPFLGVQLLTLSSTWVHDRNKDSPLVSAFFFYISVELENFVSVKLKKFSSVKLEKFFSEKKTDTSGESLITSTFESFSCQTRTVRFCQKKNQKKPDTGGEYLIMSTFD